MISAGESFVNWKPDITLASSGLYQELQWQLLADKRNNWKARPDERLELSLGKRVGREGHWLDQLNVLYDGAKSLGALLHLGQLRLAQFLTDQVRDAILANDDRYAEENLFRHAVPAIRQRAQCEHTPLCTHTPTVDLLYSAVAINSCMALLIRKSCVYRVESKPHFQYWCSYSRWNALKYNTSRWKSCQFILNGCITSMHRPMVYRKCAVFVAHPVGLEFKT